MSRLFDALRPFIRGIVRWKWMVLIVAFALSGLSLSFALKLRVDPDLANLVPPSYPSVQALERLRATVGGESEAAVAIVSPSFEANRTFADTLIHEVMGLRPSPNTEPYFNRVDYRRETDFLEANALYFATPRELDDIERYLENKIEEAKLAANPFYFELGDNGMSRLTDSLGRELAVSYDNIVGGEYPVSDDSTTMVLKFYPTGAQTNVGFIRSAYSDLEKLIDRLQPQAFHDDMEVVLAGRLLRQLTEVDFIRSDVQRSFGAGVTAVVLLVVLYFLYKAYSARACSSGLDRRVLLSELARTPVMALLIATPLFMSLTWTFGVAYVAFETLNLMTSALGLVLFGLGIDFGIHFYARYVEERSQGQDIAQAAETTFVSTGQAITVGALTTGAALYVLTVADFRGFSEFGFIAGTGIIFALLAMTTVLPALLALLEQTRLLDLTRADAVSPRAGDQTQRFPAARSIMIGSSIAVALALVMLPRVGFEYDFGSLEPAYESYNERRAITRRVYNDRSRRNGAYIVVDSVKDGPRVAAVLRDRAARDTLSPTIDRVETLQERFPLTVEAQKLKLGRIAEIRELLDDPYLKNEGASDLNRLRRASQTTDPIGIRDVPEFLRVQFASKSGEVGNFVVVYPSVGLSDGRQLILFAEDVGRVTLNDGTTYHAGSTALVSADMLRLMQAEAPWMVLATALIVLFLMWTHFGSLRWGLLATIPLMVGVLWMLLVMELVGLKLNFYNLVVLPAVLGIGNDAGAHITHRYREEGRGSIWRVLRSTGEHVAVGSVTTMVGFAGLLFSSSPGLRTIGELAVIGIGTTLLAALVFLPALIQWRENRG